MYLCHKCAGLLTSDDREDTTGLKGCGCISGYYRGIEPHLTRGQAIAAQIKAADQWLALYQRQGRDDSYILPLIQRKTELLELQ